VLLATGDFTKTVSDTEDDKYGCTSLLIGDSSNMDEPSGISDAQRGFTEDETGTPECEMVDFDEF